LNPVGPTTFVCVIGLYVLLLLLSNLLATVSKSAPKAVSRVVRGRTLM